MNSQHEYQRRVTATIATQARYEGRPFNWSKAATCAHLMRFHASNMGHNLAIVPRFRSMIGAKKALKKMGFDTLPELLDSMFDRIPASQMVVGDLMAVDGSAGWHALLVKGDRMKFLGWHESEDECQIMEVHDISNNAGCWKL